MREECNMFCRKCGNQLGDGALFCSKCGTKVDVDIVASVADSVVTQNEQEKSEQSIYLQNQVSSESEPTMMQFVPAEEISAEENQIQEEIVSVQPVQVVPIQPAVQVAGDKKAEEAEEKADKVEKKSGKKGGIIIAAILATAVLGGGAFAYIAMNGNAKSTQTALIENDGSTNETGAVEDESLEELLSLIEQAEKSVEQLETKYAQINEHAYDSSETDVKWADYAAATDECYTEVLALKEQADAITGLDDNIKSAKDFYFNTVCDSRTSLFEIYDFISRYFKFFYDDILFIPEEADYDQWYDYYNDLYDWYLAAKEGYDSIGDVPNCLVDEWKRYGDTLDMAEYACYKYQYAVQNSDYLSLESAKNIDNRYFRSEFDENGDESFVCIESKVYDNIIGHAGGETTIANNQMNIAKLLADEIKEYADLDDEAKGSYEFEYDRTGKILVGDDRFEAVSTIYPSLYNSYDSFVTIKTATLSGTRTIVVEAEIPGFTQEYKETINLDSSYTEIPIKPPVLSGDIDLSVAKDAQIKLSLYEQDGTTLIIAKTFPVTIKSVNDVEWANDDFLTATEDNILCFLTPESDAIDTLKANAAKEIANITGGEVEMMPGYQETGYGHYVGTYLQASALMRAMYDMGVRYSMDPFSSSGSHQHVKLPEEVLAKQSGLCIETSLVIASALQSMDMHAMLVMPTGHAQVAVEVWNNGEGAGEYFLIETTCLEDDSNNDDRIRNYANYMIENGVEDINPDYRPIAYMNAEEWNEYIANDPNMYIIDCNDSRILGLTPFAH